MDKSKREPKMNIKPGKISYEILKYIQDHPGKMNRTTGHRIAEELAERDDLPHGSITIEQVISRMIKRNVLEKTSIPKSMYSSFRINYGSNSIPKDILAAAPVEEKRTLESMIDRLEPGQYMDSDGCIVTPGAVPIVPQEDSDPFNEDKKSDEPGTFENPIKSEKDPWEEEPKGNTTTLPLHITKTKDGKTTNITINLTVNL